MDSVTSSTVLADFDATMNKVCESHKPVIIDRSPQPSVVVMSQEDYQVMQEACHLLENYTNSKEILPSLARDESDLD